MKEPFVSLIMVLEQSPYKTVDDLRNTRVATPPAFVPVVYMAKQSLSEHNLLPGRDLELVHFKSVDSRFQQVMIGQASACVSPPFAPAAFDGP